MAKIPKFEMFLENEFLKYFLSFKNLTKIPGNTFMDNLSIETNFTEFLYDLIAQKAIKPRHIMLYYGLE